MNQVYILLLTVGFLMGMLSCSGENQEESISTPGNSLTMKQIAFPGAEGAGKYTTGGRGGTVYEVTNLNDSGEGSFRQAIQKNETRTIVFRVSGTIELGSDLDIHYGNLTIAGQSAPGDGICIKGYPVSIKTDNVILRYIRFRLGNLHNVQGDAFSCRNRKNIVIDHCSFSWATDETASLYELHRATVQWCMITESLNHSVHEKGDHGYGGIWGGDTVSFHHNLFAHNLSRNPRFNGARYQVTWTDLVDFRNNVLYNWGDNSIYGGEKGKHNVVNNYFKPGPATKKSVRNRVLNITTSENYPYGVFYVSGNYMHGNPAVTSDNWNGGVDTEAAVSMVKASQAFYAEVIPEQSAQLAYEAVLNFAGASLARDEVDTRIISEVRNGTATYTGRYSQRPGLIDSQEDVGGWPELSSLPAQADTDHDGMPDVWEEKHQLRPTDQSDGSKYSLNQLYTNLEVYLNELAGMAQDRYEMTVAQDSTGDFRTIQEAIDATKAFPDRRVTIYIKKGVYREKVRVYSWNTLLTLKGEDAGETIISFDDHFVKINLGRNSTFHTYTLKVEANDFIAENLTIENTAVPVGQAVALHVEGDRCQFLNCRIKGHQDTVYAAGENSRQYFKNCFIEGTTDFIFGDAVAVFDRCTIYSLSDSYITAASTPKGSLFGYVFLNCNLTAKEGVKKVYLGRPWRDFARVVFLNCTMGPHILPQGWINWSGTTREQTAYYAEFGSRGAGGSAAARVSWSHQLTENEITRYKISEIFGDWTLCQ